MSTIVKRTIAVLAALLLAGASVGCDREAGDEGVTMGEPGVEEEQEGTTLGEQEGMERPEELGEAPQPGMEGDQQAAQQDQQIQQVRDEVSDELDIPASAVIIDDQVRQQITQATSDVERRGLGMVSTVETHLQRVNTDQLEQEEQQAADKLRQQVSEAQGTLQELSQAGEEQADELEDQLEDKLEEISDNWEEISDKMQFEQQPAGGGPLEEQPNLDQRQNPDQQQNMDQPQGMD